LNDELLKHPYDDELKQLVGLCKQQKMPAVAITDTGIAPATLRRNRRRSGLPRLLCIFIVRCSGDEGWINLGGKPSRFLPRPRLRGRIPDRESEAMFWDGRFDRNPATTPTTPEAT